MRARLLGWPVRKKKIFRKNVIRTKIFVHLYGLFFVRIFFRNSYFFRKNGIRKKAKNEKNSKERNSKEKNEFRKNVIRSNDLVPLKTQTFSKIPNTKMCLFRLLNDQHTRFILIAFTQLFSSAARSDA